LFSYRLALELGKTRAELLDSLSSTELSEWMAYYSIEPFGYHRKDLSIAILSALTANINRGKNQKAFAPIDFMAYMEKPNEEQELRKSLAHLVVKKK